MASRRYGPTGRSSWARTRTHDEPVGFTEMDDGRTAVHISQIVRSLEGSVISRGHFQHTHRIEGDLISRMDDRDGPRKIISVSARARDSRLDVGLSAPCG